MNTISSQSPVDTAFSATQMRKDTSPNLSVNPKSAGGSEDLREAFQDFVGQTLFGSMLASMRKTQTKPAYMHGGRAEEVFQQQMDQHLVDNITNASAGSISDPMFELFNLQRSSS